MLDADGTDPGQAILELVCRAGNLPEGRIFDSVDLSPTLLNGDPSPRPEWFYYGQPGNLWPARAGDFKLVLEL